MENVKANESLVRKSNDFINQHLEWFVIGALVAFGYYWGRS